MARKNKEADQEYQAKYYKEHKDEKKTDDINCGQKSLQ